VIDVPRARRWVASDRGADVAFKAALALSLVVLYVVGRRQWFIRDDFAFVITRNVIRGTHGVDDWLFAAQDGHWMTPPILVYRAVQNVFGLDSYWPFLLPTMLVHLTTVVLVRVLCRRCGVSPWTSTLVCSVLLVFGSGWENIAFGIQLTYNLSIVAFLAHVLLVDHEGAPDHRDVVGAVIALVGMSSSGFGPFFLFGVALLLVLRKRWVALAIATVPQALAFVWWYLTWYRDPIKDRLTGPRTRVPEFAIRGIVATFDGLVGISVLAGLALVAGIVIALWRGVPGRARTLLWTMWGTTIVMFLGIGWTRIGFGLDSAGVSRYRYMGAMLLAVALGLAIDALVRWSPAAVAAGRVVLVASATVNAGVLHYESSQWADRANEARDLYALIEGSGLGGEAAPDTVPYEFNPDVKLRWLPYLVEEGAVTPRSPANDSELARVRAALGLAPTAPP
jgi:hypothetical protein